MCDFYSVNMLLIWQDRVCCFTSNDMYHACHGVPTQVKIATFTHMASKVLEMYRFQYMGMDL